MALPSTNLWVHQVDNELGESSNDIGRLCMSLNINKWAKFKPIARPGIAFDFSYTKGDSWWGGVDGNCGLVIPVITDFSNIDTVDYTYIKPSGTENSPFRIGDFRGYDHACVMPYGTGRSGNIEYNIYSNKQVGIALNTPTITNPNNLTIDDITANYLDCYVAVEISNGSKKIWGTATNTLRDGVRSVLLDFSVAPLNNSEWHTTLTLRMALSDTPKTFAGAEVTKVLSAIPKDSNNLNPFQISIKNVAPVLHSYTIGMYEMDVKIIESYPFIVGSYEARVSLSAEGDEIGGSGTFRIITTDTQGDVITNTSITSLGYLTCYKGERLIITPNHSIYCNDAVAPNIITVYLQRYDSSTWVNVASTKIKIIEY